MDSPITEATGRRPVAAGAEVDPLDEAKLSRRAKRFAIFAAVACPCHLPLVATVLALVGFGGAAAALRDNLMVVSVVFAFMAAMSLWLAIRSSRAATSCRLPAPPPPHGVPASEP